MSVYVLYLFFVGLVWAQVHVHFQTLYSASTKCRIRFIDVSNAVDNPAFRDSVSRSVHVCCHIYVKFVLTALVTLVMTFIRVTNPKVSH